MDPRIEELTGLLYLVDGSTEGRIVKLILYDAENREFREVQDETYRPYFLVKHPVSRREAEAIRRLNGETSIIEKVDLFSGEIRRLVKVEVEAPSLLKVASRLLRERWEVNIPYLLSYVYDHDLVFGVPYALTSSGLKQACRVDGQLRSAFLERFDETRREDPEKFNLLKRLFMHCSQQIPMIPVKRLGIPEDPGYEKIYLGFLLSRVANLPLSAAMTSRHVSAWIKSLLHYHLRRRNILIPRASELRRGEEPRRVPGALTFPPKMGTYFNTVVVDFESLYPSLIDAYNLSYETVNCGHPECLGNRVPGTDHHVCVLRRGVYSVLIGALKDLRIRWFKPLARDDSLPEEERRLADAASRLLKLILVSCYGVTVRIPGLSQPALAEAITAYGRHALRRTWELAEECGLHPLYGDTDSLFLDDPRAGDVNRLIGRVKDELRLDLAVDKVYSICILPRAMKAYFGIMRDGTPEIKGITAIKSNSPPIIRRVFEDCVKELAGVKNWAEFEAAKKRIRAIVDEAIRRLRAGEVPIDDLVYRVKLHYDSAAKLLMDEALHQPYQSAVQLMDAGRRVSRGSMISFVKVKPFNYSGRRFTVKPPELVKAIHEVNLEDYVRSLRMALSQAFKPMNLKFDDEKKTTLADFI